jgi:hypothetical protein
MIWFDAAPPIPLDYPALRALSAEEIEHARKAGYVADGVDPSAPVRRAGLNNDTDAPPPDDIRDWRIRTYVVWFCYIVENAGVIVKPRSSIEELIQEFKAPEILDTETRRIGGLYAGVGNEDSVQTEDRRRFQTGLRTHYNVALKLLEGLGVRDQGGTK